MKISLYRKYRPQDFSDIVGQQHVIDVLRGALKSNKVAHAYLFSGPKGTGKTSVARILAKAINCESEKDKPCHQCSACISISEGTAVDVIEIDAASSRGIDEIRELREKIKFSPSSLKYKVFIIDEVHMLTKEAFNALLKTLEEPPSHAIFMLITTEPHKIPPTIISRCQRLDFRKIKTGEIVKRLKLIAEKENIQYEDGVLEIIALNAGGGLRDAISILDQASSLGKKVTISLLKDLLGFTESKTLALLLDFIIEGKSKEAVELINNLQETGTDLLFFVDSFINYLRNVLIFKTTGDFSLLGFLKEEEKKVKQQAEKISKEELIFLIEVFLQAKREIKEAPISQLPLEMAIIKTINNFKKPANEDKKQSFQTSNTVAKEKEITDNSNSSKNNTNFSASTSQNLNNPKNSKNNDNDNPNNDPKIIANMNNEEDLLKEIQEKWPLVIEKIKKYNSTLAVFLKSATPIEFGKNNCLVVSFLYEFHKTKSLENKNKIIIERIISEVLGRPIEIKGTIKEYKEKNESSKNSNSKENHDIIKDALEIFNGRVIE